LKLKNAGKTRLIGEVKAPVDATFVVNSGGGSFNLPPKGRKSVVLQFVPATSGAASSSISITSTDPSHRSVSVSLLGTGK
jgi:hypothetical protein